MSTIIVDEKKVDFKAMSIIGFHFYFLKYKIYAYRYTCTTHRQTHTHRKKTGKFYMEILFFISWNVGSFYNALVL